MTRERYTELMVKGKQVTNEEYQEGWHFCSDWDLLLVGPGMPEEQVCNCWDERRKI